MTSEQPLAAQTFRAVLFDLDGTLADTAPDLGYALNLQLERHGRPSLPLMAIRPFASEGARGLLKLGFGIDPDHAGFTEMRAEYLQLYEDNLCRHTTLFPGITELFDALAARGIPWGIVTNKPQRFTAPLVKLLGIDRSAACVVSGDMVPRAKPHPDSLLRAAEQLAVPPAQIVYVGDDQRDVAAAHSAGMGQIIAGYGYLGGTAPETWGAQAIIDRPAEVLNFL